MEIAKAVVTYLDADEAVDTARGIGVQGYCMGGPFAVWTAAAAPERVKAAASFHGGGLVGEEETSPVKVLGQTQASYLFAIARTTTARARRQGRAQGRRRGRRPAGPDQGLPRRPRLDRGGFAGLQRRRGRRVLGAAARPVCEAAL